MTKRKHPNRDKTKCHETKQFLIERYGTTCMLCHNDFGKKITHHHMKPRYSGGSDDVDNGSLLCERCQNRIHHYDYGTQEYSDLTNEIEDYKVNH